MSPNTETRRCNKCHVKKPLTPDYFFRHPASKRGLATICKEYETDRLRSITRLMKQKPNIIFKFGIMQEVEVITSIKKLNLFVYYEDIFHGLINNKDEESYESQEDVLYDELFKLMLYFRNLYRFMSKWVH